MEIQNRYWKIPFMFAGIMLFVVGFSVPANSDVATQGSLEARDPEGRALGYCPLRHTDVRADISGFIARVTVTQQFENPYGDPIEAVYTFPMSDRAAVDSMQMTIGSRIITGNIMKRAEARRVYENARAAGQAAGLLDQERPNIFTQSVANILPGEAVTITISYVEYLDYADGEYEFSFPMVVGPRYIPGSTDCLTTGSGTAQVPDASRITPPVTPEGTRAGHDISLRVNLNAGLPISGLASKLHEVDLQRKGDTEAVISLKNQQEIPNRDFVLNYGVAGQAIGDAVLTHADAEGGFFSLILQPPERVTPEHAAPKEMIFVIDASGSMRGFPIEKAKRSMRLAIEQMNPNDTFNLMSFAGGVGYCFAKPVANTPANRSTALAYLNQLQGGGGTEMMGAIHAALGAQDDPERLRIVCFMTDGYIGNDMAILDAIQKYAHQARVFAFGIGNSVNRFLIEGMAREGRGESEIITLESDGDAAAIRFHERIHSPVLTDITLDFGGLDVHDLYPTSRGIPDLFSTKPLVVTGRYDKAGDGYITLRGRTADGAFARRIHISLPETEPENDVLASLWARERIDHLMAQDWLGVQHGKPAANLEAGITDLGLEFGLVTQFTSFVAVEEKVINEGGQLRTVRVPVEMADGVSYQGVYGSVSGGLRIAKSVAASPQSLRVPAPARGRSGGQVLYDRRTASRGAVVSATVEELEQRGSRDRDDSQLRFARPAEQEPVLAPVDEVSHAKRKPELSKEALASALAKLAQPLKVLVGPGENALEVVILLDALNIENLNLLKEMGVDIISTAHSRKAVFAKVRAHDLLTLAGLEFVLRIEPPNFQ